MSVFLFHQTLVGELARQTLDVMCVPQVGELFSSEGMSPQVVIDICRPLVSPSVSQSVRPSTIHHSQTAGLSMERLPISLP